MKKLPELFINGQIFDLSADFSDYRGKISDDAYSALTFCHQWVQGESNFYVCTSGSTGKPKKICLSREQMTASALMTGKALQLKDNGALLMCLSPRYIAGLMMLVRGIVLGLPIVVMDPSANPLASLSYSEPFALVSFVPLQLQTIIDSSEQILLSQFQNILVGGAPLNTKLLKQVGEIRTPVYHTYGMTETASHVALRLLNSNKPEQYFTPLPGVEVQTDERQCLQIRSQVTRSEWVQTHDIVELLPDGRFLFLGRSDNVINTGAIKIQAEQIEQKIQTLVEGKQLPGIAGQNLCIIGMPHAKFGEEICIVLEGKETFSDIMKLQSLLQTELQKFELPRVYFMMEKIPQTNNGKPDRRALKEQITHGHYYQSFRIKT